MISNGFTMVVAKAQQSETVVNNQAFVAKLKKPIRRAKLKTKLSLSAAVAKMEAHD